MHERWLLCGLPSSLLFVLSTLFLLTSLTIFFFNTHKVSQHSQNSLVMFSAVDYQNYFSIKVYCNQYCIKEPPSLCIRVCAKSTLVMQPVQYPPPHMSYPFITSEGSSVSTQGTELLKRLSGGRAVLFPATFL